MTKRLSKKVILICCIAILCLAAVGTTIFLLASKNKQAFRDTKTYKVTFYSDNNTVLKIDHVMEHHDATPPVQPEMTYGNIFVKWKEDFTDINSDMEVHPEIKSVKSENNVFALTGVYGTKGSDVIVTMRLCGDVCISGFELKANYDPAKLELISIFNVDGGVLFNDEESGVIKINYVSIENTVSDVDICTFKFKVKADNGEVPINTTVISAYANNGDDMYKVEYMTVDSFVYIY